VRGAPGSNAPPRWTATATAAPAGMAEGWERGTNKSTEETTDAAMTPTSSPERKRLVAGANDGVVMVAVV
jgi:hypothetical protein